LVPLDRAAILASVAKTHRVVIVQEAVRRGGVASDIASIMQEEVFYDLDAPVQIVAVLNIAIPFNLAPERGQRAAGRRCDRRRAPGAAQQCPVLIAPSCATRFDQGRYFRRPTPVKDTQMAEAILVPQVGQDLTEAKIVAINVKLGDTVAKGDIVGEVESEKSTFEVEAFCAGVVISLPFALGDVAPVLEPLMHLGAAGETVGGTLAPVALAPFAAPAPVAATPHAPCTRPACRPAAVVPAGPTGRSTGRAGHCPPDRIRPARCGGPARRYGGPARQRPCRVPPRAGRRFAAKRARHYGGVPAWLWR